MILVAPASAFSFVMKQIPLSQGKFALVDDEDYEFLMQWKWYTYWSWNTFYVARNSSIKGGKKKCFLKIHRVILNVSDSNLYVDHIDGNGLNNQKSNLRVCTNSENSRNRGAQANNKSGFKGVCWYAKGSKWHAQITVNKNNVHIGYFDIKEDAAHAYNEAAKKYHGEFAKMNKLE